MTDNNGERKMGLKFGVIGTGSRAEKFAKTIRRQKEFEITAICDLNLNKAKRYAMDHNVKLATDKISDIWEVVDAVYITTPPATHVDIAKEALLSKKHVLCEKPLALAEDRADMLFTLADVNDTVIMEVMPTKYCEGYRELLKVAKSGKIGTIMDVEASYTKLTPTNKREITDEKYGGAVVELGNYCILPIIDLLGAAYNSVSFHSLFLSNGVDTYSKIYFDYGKATATAKVGLEVKSEGNLVISGTKGSIYVPSPWWMTSKFQVRYEDPKKNETFSYNFADTGFQYELDEFSRRAAEAELFGKQNIRMENGRRKGNDELISIRSARVIQEFLKDRFKTFEETGVREHIERAQQVKIWAHRGCSMYNPENTLEAFKAAADLKGLTGIEFDIQMTRDGEIVVIHDESVERTTDGIREVKDYKLSEIRALTIDAGGGMRTNVPTLEEVLRLLKPYCIKTGLLLNIELKTGKYRYKGIEEKALALVRKYELSNYVIWSSFRAESIKHIKELDPKAKTGMLGFYLEDCIVYGRKVGADALHPCVAGLNVRLPKYLKGVTVRAWNTDEPFFKGKVSLKEAHLERYLDFGVTDIFTNIPEMYLKRKTLSINDALV